MELHSQRVLQADRFENWFVRFLFSNPIRDLYIRRIEFSGEFVGVVEWRGSLYESVAVNGVVYRNERNLGMAMIPRFEIPIQAGRPATLVVEVRSHNWGGFWPVIDAFRIFLDGRTLYEEGLWPADPPVEGRFGPGPWPPRRARIFSVGWNRSMRV